MSNKKQINPSIFIRADASIEIGIGHIMRTLALADKAKNDGIEVYYLCFLLPKTLEKKIDNVLYLKKLDDVYEIINLANIYNPFAIILDSYSLNEEYETVLKKSTNATIVAYEDLDKKHNSDIVINPNIYAKSEKENHLYGTQWAILRKEFKQKFHKTSNQFTLTVTLGGSDEKNITAQIIKHLKKWHISFFANIILGATNPHKYKIYQLLRNRNNFKLHIDPKNFATLLANADLVIIASGQTTTEVLHLKKPSIAINVTDNQNKITQELKEKKLSMTLDSLKIREFTRILNRLYVFKNRYKINHIQIQKQSILKEIKCTSLKNFTLIPFKRSDCDELYELANEKLIRENSLISKNITKDEHRSWCEHKLKNNTEIFIVRSNSGIFLGYVRFEETISIALSKFSRGCLLSEKILKLALARTDKKVITAEIKSKNLTSIHLFKKCGFKLTNNSINFVTMVFENQHHK